MIDQKEFRLPPFERGYHLITDLILDHLGELPDKGLVNLFVKHTSAGITINENADPSVREDFRSSIDLLFPDNAPHYVHNYEGPDDMPAHLKTSTIGNQITIPITNRKLNMGIWQGIYFCEFRDYASSRSVIATIYS